MLFTTFGSLGDLHPYVAVGLGMQARGHDVTIASSEVYRQKVEGEGLRFRPVRPDIGIMLERSDMMIRAMDPWRGTEYIIREVMMPAIEQSYADTLDAARDADFIVGHMIAFATPTVAEVLKKPWISVALQPTVFLSAHDPPSISAAPALEILRDLGPGFWGLAFRGIKRAARTWGKPLDDLRARLGLRPLKNAAFDGMYSPLGTQAWFSRMMANPQPDWYPNTTVTGFPVYDKLEPGQEMSEELERFLKAGAAPVVFTLGSAAVFVAGSFYEESLKAVERLGCRAVMLAGIDERNFPKEAISDNVFFAQYAPYSELFHRSAAIVHQGGVGTTAQSLRSGSPMIIVPWSHDQPDNGRRVANFGAGRVIPRKRYTATRVESELRILLSDPSYAAGARRAAEITRAEDGVANACDGLEQFLRVTNS